MKKYFLFLSLFISAFAIGQVSTHNEYHTALESGINEALKTAGSTYECELRRNGAYQVQTGGNVTFPDRIAITCEDTAPIPDPPNDPPTDPAPMPDPPTDPAPIPPPTTGNYPGVPMPNWDYNSAPVNARRISASTTNIVFNGTADNMDYVDATGLTFTKVVTLSGQYGCVIGGNFYGPSTALEYAGNHICIRGAKIRDTATGNGATMGGIGSDIYITESVIQGAGKDKWNGYDHHCWKFSKDTHRVWIVNNTFSDCVGDAIQVGDASRNTPDEITDIYIIGNHAENNVQTAFWVKNAKRVLIAYNTATNHNFGGDSVAVSSGGQDNHSSLWLMRNRFTDSHSGIKIAGTSGGTGRYFIENDVEVNVTPNPDADNWGYGFGIESQSGSPAYSFKNKTNFMIARRLPNGPIHSCGQEQIPQTRGVDTACNLSTLKNNYKTDFGVEAPF